MTTDQTPPTERFYCEGCNSWHETPRLLDAVRAEVERIRLEKGEATDERTDRD
jgi:hypothetical protein